MARLHSQSSLPQPMSLLDRLLDADPPVRPGTAGHRAITRAHLIRDLESLLNARRSSLELPSSLSQLPDSLLTYGLDDVAGSRAADVSRLVDNIRETLTRHEPRLTDVRVERLAPQENAQGLLEIAITASLRDDGSPLQLRLGFDSANSLLSVEEVRA